MKYFSTVPETVTKPLNNDKIGSYGDDNNFNDSNSIMEGNAQLDEDKTTPSQSQTGGLFYTHFKKTDNSKLLILFLLNKKRCFQKQTKNQTNLWKNNQSVKWHLNLWVGVICTTFNNLKLVINSLGGLEALIFFLCLLLVDHRIV